jgi:hypothetical protein
MRKLGVAMLVAVLALFAGITAFGGQHVAAGIHARAAPGMTVAQHQPAEHGRVAQHRGDRLAHDVAAGHLTAVVGGALCLYSGVELPEKAGLDPQVEHPCQATGRLGWRVAAPAGHGVAFLPRPAAFAGFSIFAFPGALVTGFFAAAASSSFAQPFGSGSATVAWSR